ncbi:MAG: hypothetical protein HYV40_05815 [Candidatus Levybacteria bacterium]|nr:hypothetical protein [Candidatus Levybacteria bacterium]
MKLPKELTTVTPISKLLALVIFFVSLFVAFILGMQYQQVIGMAEEQLLNMQSIAVTQQKPSISPDQNDRTIDDIIMYMVPSGWTKTDAGNAYTSLRSHDFSENVVPAITNGVEIRILQNGRVTNKTLGQFVAEDVHVPDATKHTISQETLVFNGIPVIRKFFCWEGCYDGYYFKSNGKIWQLDIACEPGCGSHEKIMAKYGTVINKFLQSIMFKQGQ